MSEVGDRKALLVSEFKTSRQVRIKGVVEKNATRFDINVRSDPNDASSPLPLHLAFHINAGKLVANYYQKGWSSYHTTFPNMPIKNGANFEVIVQCKPNFYEIIISGNSFCSFKHHLSSDIAKAIEARGHVNVSGIEIQEIQC